MEIWTFLCSWYMYICRPQVKKIPMHLWFWKFATVFLFYLGTTYIQPVLGVFSWRSWPFWSPWKTPWNGWICFVSIKKYHPALPELAVHLLVKILLDLKTVLNHQISNLKLTVKSIRAETINLLKISMWKFHSCILFSVSFNSLYIGKYFKCCK